jgi:hypothetical protein
MIMTRVDDHDGCDNEEEKKSWFKPLFEFSHVWRDGHTMLANFDELENWNI